MWDKTTGEPVYNAIVWQDTRTDKICRRAARPTAARTASRTKTGLPLATYFSGPKIALDPRQRRRRRASGPRRATCCSATSTPGCIWNLTGGTDGGAAHHRRHQRQPHDADGPRDARLGRRDRSTRSASRVDAARDHGLERGLRRGAARAARSQGVPIAGNLGDQQAAHVRPDLLRRRARPRTPTAPATSCCSTPARRRSRPRTACSPRSATRSATQDAVYALEGSIAVTGALVQWLRDNLEMIKAAPEVEELAQDGRRQRRRLLRAGVLGPVRAVLASPTPAASSPA